MILLSAFQVLLSRFCGQRGRDGGHADRRPQPPGDGRADRLLRQHSGAPRETSGRASSFEDLLGQVRQETLDAYAHQDLPFEKLVEELAPERSLAHTPAFPGGVRATERAPGELALPRRAAAPRCACSETLAKFDIDMTFAETADGIGRIADLRE